jgi:alpha-L-rhamnosidase
MKCVAMTIRLALAFAAVAMAPSLRAQDGKQQETPAAEKQPAPFAAPIGKADLDPAAFAQWVDGAESAPPPFGNKPADPASFCWTRDSNPGYVGDWSFGGGANLGPRDLRIGFHKPVALGTILAAGNCSVSVLAPQAVYPGDLADDAQWIPGERIGGGGVTTRQGGLIWTLPRATETRAIRFTHVPDATDKAYAELTPTGLRCEYRRDPLGIDETKPRLSWQLESSDPAARSQRQTAYQILVASSRQALDKHQGDLWDSGKVVTNQAVRIEYAGKPLTSRQECYWNVRAWDQDGKVSAWSAPALWTMGLLRPEDWTAKWILDDESPPDREPVAPLFRKTFDLPSAPVRATVYVSSLGYHELYLNGQKVGSAVLAPQVSLMDRYVFYTTHDVSRLVREGRNGIGLWLGDGFVSRFFPHSRPQGIVQLEIECRDGSRVTVTTDETWKTHPSHIRRFGEYDYDNYGGERFDCGRELPDWNQPTLNDADWKPVRARTTGTPTLREAVEMDVPDRLTVRTPAGTPVLRAQTVPPNVVLQELSPKEITTESNQSCTVDLGQMVTGWFAFSGQGKPGQAVTLSYLQALKDGIVSKDVIIPDSEGRARSCNKFNYHTFRYVRVEGLAKAPQAGQIKALRIGPGLTPTFSFTCSSDLANRIHQASMNTLLANSIGGYISDCPDRERAAYAGYCLAYAPFLMQHFAEGIVFLEKTIRDAVDAQRQDGLSATCSPVGPGGPAGKWTHQAGGGAVFAQAPWQIYLYTGDTRAMAMARAAAEKYLAALPRYFNDKAALVGVGQWDYLADWYAVIDGEGFNPLGKVIQANSMYILALERLSKSLEVLGEREAAARYGALADERRRLFHAHYYKTADANYGLDHMTYLAEPLLAEVPPEDEAEAVFRALEHNIRVVAKGHPTSGDGGTHNLLQCLLARQRPDLVYLMVNQTEPPSWGAMVKNGDASIWEHWFMSQAGHHSRCHVGVGSIGEWFLNGLAGIQCDPTRPGFQHAIVRPYFPPDMDFLSASSDSVQGRIAVSWRKRDGAVTLEVSIHPNTTATLVLPVGVPESITESGRPVAQAPGIEASVTRDGLTFLELGSGKYVFAWTRGASE